MARGKYARRRAVGSSTAESRGSTLDASAARSILTRIVADAVEQVRQEEDQLLEAHLWEACTTEVAPGVWAALTDRGGHLEIRGVIVEPHLRRQGRLERWIASLPVDRAIVATPAIEESERARWERHGFRTVEHCWPELGWGPALIRNGHG